MSPGIFIATGCNSHQENDILLCSARTIGYILNCASLYREVGGGFGRSSRQFGFNKIAIFVIRRLIGIRPCLHPGACGEPLAWLSSGGLEEGTRYHFKFKGLIPDGLYSLWHFPGSGGGALASHRPDDINNVFTANPAGNANFVVVGTAGNMTFGGSVGACTLPTSENIGSGYDFVGGLGDALFLLEYHNDQRTHGPLPGPFNTFAAPLAFVLDVQ